MKLATQLSLFCSIILCLCMQSCKEEDTLFESMPASHTNITFANNLENKKLFNILYYLYYYNGGGVATGDINNDGLPDIYFTANSKGNNKLYLNKGNFQFEDITAKAGVAGSSDWCTGVTMADVNNDGYLDIYVCAVANKYGLKGRNELFINNGSSPSLKGEGRGEITFTESGKKYGLDFSGFSTQAAFFDYDHDGDLDCYVLNQSHHPHANIVDTSNRRTFDTLSGDRLFRNNLISPSFGGGQGEAFTDVSKQAGIYQSNLGYGLGIATGDLNNDGWDDIYIGNDFHENDYYYVNNGDGTFNESGAKHFKHYSRFSMGNDIADYNNDAQPDVITVDMLPPDEKTVKTYGSDENPDIYKVKLQLNGYQFQYSKNCLQRNNGDGESFSETSLFSGVAATDWSWSPLFADFDNDGNKDLFISSGIVKRPVDLDYVRFVSDLEVKKGMNQTDQYDDDAIKAMPDGSSHPFLFKNTGDNKFNDVSKNCGFDNMKGYFNGAAYCDLDNDGRLDVVINCLNAPAKILKNNSKPANYISVSCRDDSMNTQGIGCKVYLFQKNKMQYQQVMATRGFESASDTRLHFGLDSLATIDSMLIVWPDQKFQLLKNIAADTAITVMHKDAAGMFDYHTWFPKKQPMFEDVTSQINCNWKHKEDDFVDFNIQYLIPHEESTRGPKIATADVNKDGLDDFYACGAKGQPGALMIQHKHGAFISSDTALFNKDAMCEDVDAVFFDANGDGWQDLLVISGGNEQQGNTPFLLSDRLYINNGKGQFERKDDFLVQKFYNKSCAAVADVDHDGDSDIFIGVLANTFGTEFGKPMTSYLFLNDGKAKFTMADVKTIDLYNIGTVTAASFADINNDGWQDLIVTGEWMSVKIFINNKGTFKEADIANSTGLWQTVYATDINHDGFTDILAGNWGKNTKLYAGKTSPLKLYVKDFDNNGSVEQILCYTVDGNEYTFLAKDELERPLPVLKKAYLTYSEVAGKTVQYMFYDLFKDYIEMKAEVLPSSCFINDGKGNFSRMDLPDELQLAPVFAFAPVQYHQTNSFFAAGNFYGVVPYEGRYDALLPTVTGFDKNKFGVPAALPAIDGEVRDAKWLNTANGKLLVVARNNMSLIFLKQVAQ